MQICLFLHNILRNEFFLSTTQKKKNRRMGITTKNILVKTSNEIIKEFKEIGLQIFRDNDKIYLFSYKTFLKNTLLNMQVEYEKLYLKIESPTAEYIDFYKRKGSIIVKTDTGTKANMGFTLEPEYYDLYYSLMHTFYINESQHLSNYSVSVFFGEIVNFCKEKKQEILIDVVK